MVSIHEKQCPLGKREKTVAVSACNCAKGHYRHLNKETSDNCVSLETQKPRRDTRDTRDNLENDGIPSIESTVHKDEPLFKEKHIESEREPGDDDEPLEILEGELPL